MAEEITEKEDQHCCQMSKQGFLLQFQGNQLLPPLSVCGTQQHSVCSGSDSVMDLSPCHQPGMHLTWMDTGDKVLLGFEHSAAVPGAPELSLETHRALSSA